MTVSAKIVRARTVVTGGHAHKCDGHRSYYAVVVSQRQQAIIVGTVTECAGFDAKLITRTATSTTTVIRGSRLITPNPAVCRVWGIGLDNVRNQTQRRSKEENPTRFFNCCHSAPL